MPHLSQAKPQRFLMIIINTALPYMNITSQPFTLIQALLADKLRSTRANTLRQQTLMRRDYVSVEMTDTQRCNLLSLEDWGVFLRYLARSYVPGKAMPSLISYLVIGIPLPVIKGAELLLLMMLGMLVADHASDPGVMSKLNFACACTWRTHLSHSVVSQSYHYTVNNSARGS